MKFVILGPSHHPRPNRPIMHIGPMPAACSLGQPSSTLGPIGPLCILCLCPRPVPPPKIHRTGKRHSVPYGYALLFTVNAGPMATHRHPRSIRPNMHNRPKAKSQATPGPICPLCPMGLKTTSPIPKISEKYPPACLQLWQKLHNFVKSWEQAAGIGLLGPICPMGLKTKALRQ